MSKKYQSLAKSIVSLVGGANNITRAYHCQTRLRFTLIDDSKVDLSALEACEGVAKAIHSGGMIQVVIGPHVKDVFDEVSPLLDLQPTTQQPKEKKSIFSEIFGFIAGVFQPVIPALSGAGMVKAVLALLLVFGFISRDSQTYYLFNLFSDGVFYFLPMMLAYTTAQKMKCNPILAVSVAAIMMHPNWSALVSAQEPVFFFEVIPFTLASYTSSVIPIILIIFVQAYVEKLLQRWIPKSVDLVFVPMLTLLIMGTLALSVLGPIGTVFGNYLATIFTYLSANYAWAPAVLIGGFLPIMVMFGLHNGVAPLGVMQMAEVGYDSIFGPGCVCSNMAQATAGAVVAMRSKNQQVKQLATSGSITAYMGITEPILYGINLPKKYPLIASMIGGGLGGLYAGLTQTHRFATGSSGIPAVLLYIGDDTMIYFYNILIAIVISVVVTAILTFFLSLKCEEKVVVNPIKTQEPLLAVAQGNVIAIEDVKDETFASEVLGKTMAILPQSDQITSPCDGEIVSIFPTKHAIGIRSTLGNEVLIHVGIDTVNLQGEHFDLHVAMGDHVKAKQPLLHVDFKAIEDKGYDPTVLMILTNTKPEQKIHKTITETIEHTSVAFELGV